MLSCCGKPGREGFLSLSQREVLPGETLVARVFNGPANPRFVWHFPDYARVLKYDTYDSGMVYLTFLQSDNSTKEICVKVYEGADTAIYATYCQEIKVNSGRPGQADSIASEKVESLAGDRLTLQPVIYSTDSSLNFIVQTKNNYSCLNAHVNYTNASVKNNIVSLVFKEVGLPYSCVSASMPAVSFCSTYSYYKDGNYPIEITFNNKVYKGSVTVSQYQSKYEFNWPYTEGIVIEPKVLERP